MRLIRYVVSQSHAIARRERVGFSPRIFSPLNTPVALPTLLHPLLSVRFTPSSNPPRDAIGLVRMARRCKITPRRCVLNLSCCPVQ